MAFSSLFALIDDIATVLDDVAVLAKVAARKTAGVLGDDLALNAEQVAGVRAARELPVVWAVAKGSLMNKAILVPVALALSALAPWAVMPLLMVGGLFLCFEGAEKLLHPWLHEDIDDVLAGDLDAHGQPAASTDAQALHAALTDPSVDLMALEADKVKGAIRTDFVLSAEIIAITLGTVAEASFQTQVLVLCGIAVLMTAGVYGIVAAIVKLDDVGLWMTRRPGQGALMRLVHVLGRGMVDAAPWLMKALSVAGLVAVFLVGGGILTHGLPVVHHAIEQAAAGAGPGLAGLGGALGNALFGLAAGLLSAGLVLGGQGVWRRLRS